MGLRFCKVSHRWRLIPSSSNAITIFFNWWDTCVITQTADGTSPSKNTSTTPSTENVLQQSGFAFLQSFVQTTNYSVHLPMTSWHSLTNYLPVISRKLLDGLHHLNLLTQDWMHLETSGKHDGMSYAHCGKEPIVSLFACIRIHLHSAWIVCDWVGKGLTFMSKLPIHTLLSKCVSTSCCH